MQRAQPIMTHPKGERAASWISADRPYRRWRLIRGWVMLVLAAALATLVSAAVIETQAGVTGYLTGEGHWSRARLETVYHLERYALVGNPRELALARKALEVPLGDRAARLALERRPADEDAAWRGFLQGRNNPDDIPRLIRFYKYFSGVPFFAEAVSTWRRGEPQIFRLQRIADRLEAHWREPGAGPVAPEVLAELDAINAILQPMERDFAENLLRGARKVRTLLLLFSSVLFLAIAGLALLASRSAIRSVRATESRFRAAFQQASVGMAKLDRDGIVLAANEELTSMLLRPAETLTGKPFSEHFVEPVPADGGWMARGQPEERKLHRADGTWFWCRITASAVHVEDGRERVFLILEDVSEAHDLSETLVYQASHDSLTGLINRREIDRRLQLLLAEAHACSARHTLCLLDLDQFKLINDSSSHAAGDEVLRLVAATLPLYLGQDDWIGRLGGDEFAILLHGKPVEQAVPVAQRLNRALADTYLLWEGRHFPLTASLGVVEMNAESPGVHWLLRAADAACYLAKERGSNRVQVYVEDDEQLSRRHDDLAWVGKVRAAIAEDRMRLYAQRIDPLDHQPGRVQYEVLLRMVDATGQLCSPGAFLPAAERYGQAVAIDLHVLALLLRELSRHPWHLEQLDLCHVNVSGQSVVSAEFLAGVQALFDAYPQVASKLCFELTETASIDCLPQARAFIDAVHARGCLVALDDFGSGLSSFAYLKNLSVDILKIDGLFVRDIDSNPLDRAIVGAITDVARSQGKRTIAEWVESEAVKACLQDIGVDAGQGYAIHRPVPLRELLEGSRESAGAGAGGRRRRAEDWTLPVGD